MDDKTYLYLSDVVYRPVECSGVFGDEIKIEKKNGDEIHFTFLNTGMAGIIEDPTAIGENNEKNAFQIQRIREKRERIKLIRQDIGLHFMSIERAGLPDTIN